jgi:hypothetical protein
MRCGYNGRGMGQQGVVEVEVEVEVVVVVAMVWSTTAGPTGEGER